MKTIKDVPDEGSQKELKEWARKDFKDNKHLTDEVNINSQKQKM